MEIVRLDSLDARGWPSPAVSAGNFDGVHRGHQALVDLVVQDAIGARGTAVALTFDPHPSRVLSPDRAPASLMSVAQKAEVLSELGVDKLAVLPFTLELSRQTPEAFVRGVLHGALGARVVVVGSSFRFGRQRAGDVAALAAFGAELGFRVHSLDPVMYDGAPISSTRIREVLARGAVESAREMLGRGFCVEGRVELGEGRGRLLGFPTANLLLVNEMLPAPGVYACWCRRVAGAPVVARAAVVNVGRRPTFGSGGLRVEAHLLDYTADLYGDSLRLEFVQRLREERAFADSDALAAQIRRDAEQARQVLEKP